MRARTWFAVPLAATLCTACALVLGIDERPPYPEATDASDAATEGGDASAFDPCSASTVFPPRPPDAVGGPALDFVIRHPGFQGAPADAGGGKLQVCPFGSFNVDGLDTCNGMAGPPTSACVPRADAGPACDLGEGRDDALGALISRIPDGTQADSRIENGELGLMISVSGWSGGPDDGNVTVDFFALGPVEATAADAGPAWNGSDSWSMDKASCTDPTCSIFSAYRGEGYVAGGVLFAHAPHLLFPLHLADSRVAFTIDDVILTGVVHAGAGLALTLGRFAGRVDRESALRQLGRASFFGSPFCESKTWPFAVGLACGQADLPLETGESTAPCDAFSVGITFEGWRAVRGKAVALDAGLDCPDAASFACP